MDHRVRVASITFWSLFFINLLVGAYVIVQFVLNNPLFGNVPLIFLAIVNAIVCIISAIGMSIQEPYRL